MKKAPEEGVHDRGVASSLERPAFRVRIGTARPAAGAGKSAAKLSSRIRAGVMKQGRGAGASGGGKRFSTGRGGRAAAQFAARSGRQRVTIKARVVRARPGGKSAGSLRAHLRYIRTRDQMTPGRGGELFNGEGSLSRDDVADLAARMEGDRHHFRFILSAEHGGELDLKAYTREVVANMEKDLGTKLDWVAGQHHDTDNPHVHLMIRGKDERGGDLVINRGYISHGMREQAAEVATRHLGPRLAEEIERTRERELRVDRATGVDLQLAAEALARPLDDRISLWQRADGTAVGERERLAKITRLHHLESLGLARERSDGDWSVDPQLVAKLRRLGTRNDVIKLMHERLTGQAAQYAIDPVILNKDEFTGAPILGRVVDRGVSDELYDRHHLVLEASDGKTYYVPLGTYSERAGQEAAIGSVVTITRVAKPQSLGAADRNIAAQAQRQDGIYDPAAHEVQLAQERKALPPGATLTDYVASHRNRAQALASRGVIEALADGKYRIPTDLTARIAAAYAPTAGRDSGNILQVERHSAADFASQVSTRGVTWLDAEMLRRRLPAAAERGASEPVRKSDSRFERGVGEALAARQRALQALGADIDEHDRSERPGTLLDRLYEIEIEDAGRRLRAQFGEFERFQGTRRGTVASVEELPSGPHAVLVNGDRFTLVPASATLARQVGKHVEVTARPGPAQDALQPRHINQIIEHRVVALKRSRGLPR